MDTPCSVTRRQAWAQCSRQWLTVEDNELQTSGIQNSPATQLQDEIFTNNRSQSSANECSTGKIETWLQGCGHEVGRDNPVQPTVESFLKAGNSFEDDLGLGAEAIAPDDGFQDKEFGHCPLLLPPPKSRKHFHLFFSVRFSFSLCLCI
ncbi:protein TESPA1-like [Trichomycterus rosablanca]|uniref:protein TESPA1-like n=1 Tax=Trichomycterus rosablanca TaxID=2290929 RepID=UPI002F355E27